MPLILPGNSIKYLLYQRTEYLKSNRFFKLLTFLGSSECFYKASVFLKSLFFPSLVREEFGKDMDSEFNIIKQHLPEKADAILDIGCGIAGIDVYISKYYNNKLEIFLIDKTYISKTVYYYFKESGAFYNSLGISKELLKVNGVDPELIHAHEASDDNAINFDRTFDIVISLLSLGFHYPVTTYLHKVYEKLKKGGTFITDIRKGTDGEKEINKLFGNFQIIHSSRRFIRVLSRKNR